VALSGECHTLLLDTLRGFLPRVPVTLSDAESVNLLDILIVSANEAKTVSFCEEGQ